MLDAPTGLVVCPSCSRHARREELSCPHCGERFPTMGPLRRTAAAVVMGLSAATILSSELVACSVYGIACTGDECEVGSGGAAGSGGTSGTGGAGGAGGENLTVSSGAGTGGTGGAGGGGGMGGAGGAGTGGTGG